MVELEEAFAPNEEPQDGTGLGLVSVSLKLCSAFAPYLTEAWKTEEREQINLTPLSQCWQHYNGMLIEEFAFAAI
jgi:hypothetical protein